MRVPMPNVEDQDFVVQFQKKQTGQGLFFYNKSVDRKTVPPIKNV